MARGHDAAKRQTNFASLAGFHVLSCTTTFKTVYRKAPEVPLRG